MSKSATGRGELASSNMGWEQFYLILFLNGNYWQHHASHVCCLEEEMKPCQRNLNCLMMRKTIVWYSWSWSSGVHAYNQCDYVVLGQKQWQYIYVFRQQVGQGLSTEESAEEESQFCLCVFEGRRMRCWRKLKWPTHPSKIDRNVYLSCRHGRSTTFKLEKANALRGGRSIVKTITV